MNARPALHVLLVLAVFTLLYVPPAGAEGELTVVEHDNSAYPRVTLVVTGPSFSGDAVESGAFEVTENGLRVDATVERLDGTLDVVLAVDTSGSMVGGALDAARDAATAFVGRLRADTRVAVVGFGPTPNVVLPFTTDRAALQSALATLVPRGDTPLYDGVAAAAALFEGSTAHRRALVVLSDGGDTASAASLPHALDATSGAGASVWAVSLTTAESDRAALDSLVGSTGGRVVAAEDPAALDAAYREVAGDLAVRYRVTFDSASTGATTLKVAVRDVAATAEVVYPMGAATTVSGGATSGPRDGGSWLLVAGAAAVFASVAIALSILLVSRGSLVRLASDSTRSTKGAHEGLAGFANRASAVAERTLDRRGRRRGVEAALEQAGIQLRAGEAVIIGLSVTFGVAAGASLVGGWLLAPVGGALAAGGCVAAIVVLRNRRRQHFADQVDDLLQMIAGSLRAGYGLVQAVELASHEMPAPAGDELRRLTTEVRLGRELADALDGVAERMANDDFVWAVQAIRIHHEVGGDLSAVLERVAETIRARAHLRRQVSALSAEGRVSALILTILPIGLLGVMTMLNGKYVGYLFSTVIGGLLLAGATVLMLAGALWLRHIVRPVY